MLTDAQMRQRQDAAPNGGAATLQKHGRGHYVRMGKNDFFDSVQKANAEADEALRRSKQRRRRQST